MAVLFSGATRAANFPLAALATTSKLIAQSRSYLVASANPQVPHAATAIAELVNGFVVRLRITDPGFGYTDPPTVVISGGGGTGAKARALVTDGSISSLIVTNA